MKTLSVVVATYNRGKLLLELLTDLAGQDLIDAATAACAFDVIVVDDGSRDSVRNLLAGQAYPFGLRIIEQPNAGASVARDRGIRTATAEIIVIIDDDMHLPPNFLSAHLERHENGATVVLGRIRASEQLAQMPLFERFHAWQLDEQVAASQRGVPVRGTALCTGNVSFRREQYLAVGGFDPSLKRSEDRELGLRLELAGGQFAFSEAAYSIHHSDHASLGVFLSRAFLYGVYDSRIAKKHPSVTHADPWSFFFLVNPISRPGLLFATVAPRLASILSRAAMKLSEGVAWLGLESVALRGVTFAYGVEYFRGMREEAGSLRRAIASLAAHRRRRGAGARS